MKASYTPSKKILEKYAQVMVNFGINNGKGIKKGDTVLLSAGESAKPLFAAISQEITNKGGNVIHNYIMDDPQYSLEKYFLNTASPKQLDHSPIEYYKGLVKQIDHQVFIISDAESQALAEVDPKKILRRSSSLADYKKLRSKKEQQGKFSWTMCLYGTEAMAQEANLSLKQFWNQIIKACYLKDPDPVARWKDIVKENMKIARKLNKLCIKSLHMQGEDVDLNITLSPKSKWITGSGSNVPSFEIFTSPDWRGTEGWIKFNKPLYRYGNLIEDIELHFKKGRVEKATASKNEIMLKEMIKIENADKVGEFSLTDTQVSPITLFMAETLFDENVGGKYGNTHIALGASFRDCYKGDYSKLTEAQWKQLGYNNSVVHTDMISTTDRTVTATLPTGVKKVIYQKGKFTL